MNDVLEIVSAKDLTISSETLRLFPPEQLLPGSIFRKSPEKLIRNRTIHLPKIEIMGISFILKKEGDRSVLESELWPSLRASGPKVKDAIEEMQSLLHDVIEEYVLSPEETLSDDAKGFRHYLISTLI